MEPSNGSNYSGTLEDKLTSIMEDVKTNTENMALLLKNIELLLKDCKAKSQNTTSTYCRIINSLSYKTEYEKHS